MIELCCEYLSVWCIWLYVIIMSHTRFRVSTLCSCPNVNELLARNRRDILSLSNYNRIRTRNHLAKLASWLNGWMFVYEQSGCEFESRCSHLNSRYCACFKQGVSWHSGNYRVWIHSEMCTWHGKNIQLKNPMLCQHYKIVSPVGVFPITLLYFILCLKYAIYFANQSKKFQVIQKCLITYSIMMFHKVTQKINWFSFTVTLQNFAIF